MKLVTGSCLFLMALVLAGVSSGNERKVYPNRWVRISSDMRDDSEVERIRSIVKTASEHGLNGIAFSAGLDSLDLKPPDYFRRLKAVRELCAHFSNLGYRTLAGAYYDADNLDNPRAWLEALDATPGACGIMYTTWLNKYDLLPAFGDLVSGNQSDSNRR